MAITQLPDPPSRSDPSTFAARGDALLGALQQFVTEANALLSQCELNATVSLTFGEVKDQLETYDSVKSTDGLGFVTTKGKMIGKAGSGVDFVPISDSYPFRARTAADDANVLVLNPVTNIEALAGAITDQPVTPAALDYVLDNRVGGQTPAATFASSGYQKFPSGLIIQWGRRTGSGTVTFPIAFPTAFLQGYSSCYNGSAANIETTFYGGTTTGGSVYGTASWSIAWFAIGY